MRLDSHATSGESNSTGDGSQTSDRKPWANSTQDRPPIDLDNWRFDDDVRGAEHALAMTAQTTISRPNAAGKPSSLPDARSPSQTGDSARLGETSDTRNVAAGNPGGGNFCSDSFYSDSLGLGNLRIDRPTTDPSPVDSDDRRDRSGALAWCVLLVGIMAFVCGGVLLGWSLLDGRQQLWNLGLPITIAGQAALLIGLMLQVERIWHNSRQASQRLLHVDRQLNDLQQTTALLGNRHGVASNVFYSHMAEGANPHLLLADLKGQIDMLSVKVAQQD